MTNIIDINAGQVIQDNMMAYSATVLLNRAIPDIRDGLKPSYRHILYSMYKNKVFTYTKSRSIDGETAKIHPHGSSYPTMVGMAQTDRHNQTLIDGDGWWGSYTSRDLTAAADRYTNAKLSDWSKFLFRDINKGLIEFKDNYDGTIQIPEVIPVPFPLILTMAQSGIGVGFSSKTPSYNITEVANAIIDIIKKGDTGDLIPDFPTGGIILKDNDIIGRINNEGTGTVKIRGKANIEGTNISISEIPYGTTREQIIDKVVELAKTEKLGEVSDIQDLSGKDKFEIFIKAKKGTDMELLLEKLYKFTPLEASYGVNSMVLVDGLPVLLGSKEILEKWTNWRLECIHTDIDNQIKQLEGDIELLSGYSHIDKDMDKFIEIIRYSENMIQDLIKEFNFSKRQAEHMSSIQLRNINQKYINRKTKEKEDKVKEYRDLKKLTDNDIKDILIDDMKYVIKHFGADRKSEIVDIDSINNRVKSLQKEIKYEMVDDSDYWIHITKKGFIYKTKRKSDKFTLVPQDKVVQQHKLNNKKDEVFVYTKSRNGVKEQIRNIPISKEGDFGQRFNVDEKDIVDFGVVTDKYKYILLLLTDGRVVKFSPRSYRPGTNVFKNTHTDQYDITHVLFLKEDIELELENVKKQKIRIHTKNIRVTQSRTGTGQFINNNNKHDIKKCKIIS